MSVSVTKGTSPFLEYDYNKAISMVTFIYHNTVQFTLCRYSMKKIHVAPFTIVLSLSLARFLTMRMNPTTPPPVKTDDPIFMLLNDFKDFFKSQTNPGIHS